MPKPAIKTTKGRIKCAKVEISSWGSRERSDEVLELCRESQRALNLMWQHWMAYHVMNNSAYKLIQQFDDYRKWQATPKAERGEKPAFLKPFPETDWKFSHQKGSKKTPDAEPRQRSPSLDSDLYHVVTAHCPSLNTRAVTLLTHKWKSTVESRKAAKGNLPGWAAILLGNENIPTFTRPQPIPFDASSCSTAGFTKAEKNGKTVYQLHVSVERANGRRVTDTVNLRFRRGMVAKIERLTSGEWKWKGSFIHFDGRKWYALISYELPPAEPVVLDADKTIHLIPGKRCPWVLVGDSVKPWRRFGGDGKQAERFKEALLRKRDGRSDTYNWASSSMKGHGRKRAIAAFKKLCSRWKDFTNTYNLRAAKKVAEVCRQRAIGNVVFHQPEDDEAKQALWLSQAGLVAPKRRGRRQMTWDWGKMAKHLQEQAGKDLGVNIIVEKWSKGDARGPATKSSKSPKTRKKRSRRPTKKEVLAKAD